MIKSFRDKRTHELFVLGISDGVPADLAWRAVKRLGRICFRFEGGDAYDVEFCDYH